MAIGFAIALLLCSGDNCDMVRLDPERLYPSYEACRDASEKDARRVGQLASRFRQEGRDGELICLRDITGTDLPVAARAPAASPPAPVPAPVAAAPPPMPPPAAPAPTAARRGEFRDCEHCPTMVPLPAGTFIMGSSNDSTERPPHRVTVPAVALGKMEVTEEQWGACIADAACRAKPSGNGAPSQAMTNLSWDDAAQYVQWLAKTTGKPYRLPSEAEWEYAARAGSTTNYPWGNQIGVGKANCKGCGGPYLPDRPSDATAFPPNGWGLLGMIGGVAEWTEDCWHSSYSGAPADGSAWRSARCSSHALRGGSWMNPAPDVAVSVRNFYDTSVRYVANGMRVALSLR